MKYLLVALLVCVAFVQTYGIMCFTGRTDRMRVDGDYTVTGFFNMTDCVNKFCQTRVDVSNGKVVVEKFCKEEGPCRQIVLENERDCYAGERILSESQVCRYCCDSDFCNTATNVINPPPGLTANN